MLVREGLVYALVHRDYDVAGAKCQLIARSGSVTIMSPAGPPAPITLQQLQSFRAPMLSRNPIVHYVFAQMELAEERGLGMQSMRHVAEKADLPLPTYSWDDPFARGIASAWVGWTELARLASGATVAHVPSGRFTTWRSVIAFTSLPLNPDDLFVSL